MVMRQFIIQYSILYIEMWRSNYEQEDIDQSNMHVAQWEGMEGFINSSCIYFIASLSFITTTGHSG